MRFLLPLMLLAGLTGCVGYEQGYGYGGGYPYGGYGSGYAGYGSGYGYGGYYQPGYVYRQPEAYGHPEWRRSDEHSSYRHEERPQAVNRQDDERRNERSSSPAPRPGGNVTVTSHGKPDYNPGGSSDRQ